MTTIMQLKDLLELKTKILPFNFYVMSANQDDYSLVNYITTYIKQRLQQEHDCNAYSFNADRYFNINTISNLINNQSLFATTNYIEVVYKTKPTQEQQIEIINLIPKLDENNFLIIITDKLTKKDLDAKWLNHNINNSKQVIININNYDAKTIIKHMLNKAQLDITPKALDTLLQLNMANMTQLIQETNKIILYLMPNHESINNIDPKAKMVVDVETVRDLLLDNSKYNIYQLSNAYLAGNVTQAISILNNIYQTAEDAILIAWILTEDLRKLLKLKNKLKQKQDINQALYELKIIKDSMRNFTIAEKRLNYTTLIMLLDQVANLDMVIKGVISGKDIMLTIQQIIIRMASGYPQE